MSRSIAVFGGLDASGGAGLAMDLRVSGALKIRAFPIVTCLAIQSDHKFLELKPLPEADLMAQTQALRGQELAAIKIGALGSLQAWPRVLTELKSFKVPIIVDPVFKTSSDALLISDAKPEEVRRFYREFLAPAAFLLTPNFPEAVFLSGAEEKTTPKELAPKLAADLKCNCLVKGGHGPDRTQPMIQDVLVTGSNVKVFQTLRIDKGKIRGTGCALATAIACFLALNKDNSAFALEFAVKNALDFLGNAIRSAPNLGQGVFHLFPTMGGR